MLQAHSVAELPPVEEHAAVLNPTMRRRLKDARKAYEEAVQAREDAVVAGYNAGGSLREIAEAAGMSHVGVAKMLKRLGARRTATTIDELNRERMGERLRPEPDPK